MLTNTGGTTVKQLLLNRADLCDALFEHVVFVLYSEPGAMVEGGAIRFATRYGGQFGFNYLRDDLTLTDIFPYFPVLEQCRFGLFGRGSTIPEGWHYLYLGTGNHMIAADSVYPRFKELIKGYTYANEICRDWRILVHKAVREEPKNHNTPDVP